MSYTEEAEEKLQVFPWSEAAKNGFDGEIPRFLPAFRYDPPKMVVKRLEAFRQYRR